jgi:CheY-like chemotaxis protein
MILAVDDFADGLYVLCRLLTARGYPCHTVTSGREALDFVRNHPADQPILVALDSMMPGMNGIDVLREIRTDPKMANTTVVMFSAGIDPAIREEALSMGASAWIVKGDPGAIDEICQWYERIGGAKKVR